MKIPTAEDRETMFAAQPASRIALLSATSECSALSVKCVTIIILRSIITISFLTEKQIAAHNVKCTFYCAQPSSHESHRKRPCPITEFSSVSSQLQRISVVT
jgi:hypothetical protein